MAIIDHEFLCKHWETLFNLNFENPTVDQSIKQLIQHWKQTAPVAIRSQFYQQKTLGSWSTCKMCKVLHEVKVFGVGPTPADVLIIGEAPGEKDALEGKPFFGPAGQKLTSILDSVFIRRDKIYITNSIICRPDGENRKPTVEECHNCNERLRLEIDTVKPKVILALGSIAIRTLGLSGTISEIRGQFLNTIINNISYPCYPMYHPAYLLHSQGDKLEKARMEVWEDIKRFRDYCKERNLDVF